MKKKQALAIIIASSMALSIVGCSGAETSASEGSSEMEMTEEEKREIAKSEMVAAVEASSVASSVDEAATSASSRRPLQLLLHQVMLLQLQLLPTKMPLQQLLQPINLQRLLP